METIFWCDTKFLELTQNVYQFLVWPKKFGPAPNILGPVEGQGIRAYFPNMYTVPSLVLILTLGLILILIFGLIL